MLRDFQKHAQRHPSKNECISPSRKCLINLVQCVESHSAKVENSLLASKICCIVLERTFQIKVEMMSENQRYGTDVWIRWATNLMLTEWEIKDFNFGDKGLQNLSERKKVVYDWSINICFHTKSKQRQRQKYINFPNVNSNCQITCIRPTAQCACALPPAFRFQLLSSWLQRNVNNFVCKQNFLYIGWT